MKKEIVDIRYVAKVLFLVLASVNLGHTFDLSWLGILFAIYFVYIGIVNATSRRDYSKRPRYNKIPAYGAIVPLALYWVVTPGVENGINPLMVFLPGLYLLFLAALQERSRGNGGFETFVAFDGVAALLFSMFQIPHGWAIVGIVGLLLALIAYSRRGTAWYKYLFFVFLVAILSGISYGGWRYWQSHRYEYGSRMADDYYQRERVMGFDQVAALGNFGSNYSGRYNNQVVLRVWDSLPPVYLKAASYAKYVAGIWKLPEKSAKTLTPAYYQVDYAVMEVSDSLTKPQDSLGGKRNVREVWIQSTLDNFGFVFAPYGTVGFAAKDVDSLQYYSGGMTRGLDGNGKRSDWYYFVCEENSCALPDSLMGYTAEDLQVGKLQESLMDSVVLAMGLKSKRADGDSNYSDIRNLQKILDYFKDNFTYSLEIPGLNRWNRGGNSGKDPLSLFWHAKQGFCEYYATLSVLALRRVGIPARYVTGFAHPQVEKGAPYAIFRRRHAHSWVEAYVDGHWTLFDPTPPMFTPLGTEPSWWNAKWESLSGRAARLFHLLKEGGWRRTVDGLQVYTQKITEGVAIYVVLAVALAVFAFMRIRRLLKNRQKKNVVPSNAVALEWARRLTRAERSLAMLGFRRNPGETVGAFIQRLENAKLPENVSKEKFQDLLEALREYERNRWRKI